MRFNVWSKGIRWSQWSGGSRQNTGANSKAYPQQGAGRMFPAVHFIPWELGSSQQAISTEGQKGNSGLMYTFAKRR
jgi:hypothetical protein